MTKNIIKEIIIILLLILAIILVLGVLLYEYIPTNKIIPEKVSYTTPESAKTELSEDVNKNDEELYVDYHIDSTQLNNYKKIQEYVPGRKNPFETFEKQSTSDADSNTVQSGETNKTEQNSTEKTNNTDKTTQESTGYLPDKGTK